MSEFERENRYFVIKRSDVDKFDAEAGGKSGAHYNKKIKIKIINCLGELEYLFSLAKNLPKREYVCIESNWPEYEPAWNMIQARMEGRAPDPLAEAVIQAARGARDVIYTLVHDHLERCVCSHCKTFIVLDTAISQYQKAKG